MRLFVFLLFFSTCAAAQTTDCSCLRNFDYLVDKIERNYAGFQDKIPDDSTRMVYRARTLVYRNRAKATVQDTACFRLCLDWTHFFRDRHLQMSFEPPASNEDPAVVRARYAATETRAVDEAAVRAYLDAADRGPLEGIWEMEGGNYRVALLPREQQPGAYAAWVLRADSVYWMPGQCKFELQETTPGTYNVRFFMRDHTERRQTAVLVGHILRLDNLITWQRVYPGSGALARNEPPVIGVERLDSASLLITLRSMNPSYRRPFDSLLNANRHWMGQTPLWIIDCRGNGGGSDATFKPLLPYLYTQKIRLHSMQQWASADNAEAFRTFRSDKSFSWFQRRYFGYQYGRMKRNEGEWLGKKRYFTYRKSRVRDVPKNVVLLIDGDCGSSCEQFVLYAQQSAKTLIVGENTAGVLDFSNLNTLGFPCYNWKLHYPTTRSWRVAEGKGIDNVGIPPHRYVPADTIDWVAWAKAQVGEGVR